MAIWHLAVKTRETATITKEEQVIENKLILLLRQKSVFSKT